MTEKESKEERKKETGTRHAEFPDKNIKKEK